jgi:hypothetical protein
MPFGPEACPAAVDLLEAATRNELGPGEPRESFRPRLASLTAESLVAPHALADRAMAQCCLAGLWLRFDFLDESHRISQDIDTTTGSYWHGIMHRREPDYGNAKYWFRRVGKHPVFERLGEAFNEKARFVMNGSTWDPFRFVDLCERASQEPESLGELCRDVQELEWELLFYYCYRQAAEITPPG